MSLNRTEQILHDYVQHHPEERQFWQNKVRTIVANAPEMPSAVARLDTDLWHYHQERGAVVPVFAAALRAHGDRRTSMKNLAEYWIRLWTEPRVKKEPAKPNA